MADLDAGDPGRPRADPRRVLLVGKRGVLAWDLDLRDAFRELGHDARTFPVNSRRPAEIFDKRWRRRSGLRSGPVVERLGRECARFEPHVILFLGEYLVPAAVLHMLRRLGGNPSCAGWICDRVSYLRRNRDHHALPHVFYFDSSLEPDLAASCPAARHYLPVAVNPARYPPATGRPHPRLVFAGNRSRERERFLRRIGDHVPVDVYGPSWRRRRLLEPRRRLPSRALNRLYGAYAAVLNVNQSPNTEHGVNLRTFEVCASRGVVLVEENRDLPDLYRPGTEILTYRDERDVVAGLERLIADPAERERIAAAGLARTLAEHTWAHRARSILEVLV